MSQKFNLLVVEDTPIAQVAAKYILEHLGCQVQIAANGTEALAMFQANTYDLIFMDIGLPGISGIEVTKEMRKLETNPAYTPIVALSAHYDPASKHILFEAGMDEFLEKPLTREIASMTLNKFLSEVK